MCRGWTLIGSQEEADLPLPLVPRCTLFASQIMTVVSLLPDKKPTLL